MNRIVLIRVKGRPHSLLKIEEVIKAIEKRPPELHLVKTPLERIMLSYS